MPVAVRRHSFNDRLVPPDVWPSTASGRPAFVVTVQNIDRAFEFYTEVLGGTEVTRDGDFQGVPLHHAL